MKVLNPLLDDGAPNSTEKRPEDELLNTTSYSRPVQNSTDGTTMTSKPLSTQ